MATSVRKWALIFLCVIFLQSLMLVEGQQQQVPCYFIFGDSLFDNGNNNELNTSAKADFLPYGIDYPYGSTGRFTNGKNIADFLAMLLGFSEPIPPYASTRGSDILSGLNYASGAAGILNVTGAQFGDRFSMHRQLLLHQATAGRIAGLLGNQTTVDQYLRRCLHVVNMGTSDYINNYYLPKSRTRVLKSPAKFAKLLIREFSQQLRTLYSIGSRKIAVFGIGLIGCTPQELGLYPTNGSTPCVDSINNAVNIFNNRLFSLINSLNTELPDAHFTYINTTSISDADLPEIGITVPNRPCCVVEKTTGLCSAQNHTPCDSRHAYAFFDNYHPTEILNLGAAKRAYTASLPSDASPFDIKTLIRL